MIWSMIYLHHLDFVIFFQAQAKWISCIPNVETTFYLKQTVNNTNADTQEHLPTIAVANSSFQRLTWKDTNATSMGKINVTSVLYVESLSPLTQTWKGTNVGIRERRGWSEKYVASKKKILPSQKTTCRGTMGKHTLMQGM